MRKSMQPGKGNYRDRHVELQWCYDHDDLLQNYAGQWVVVECEELVSHGDDATTVVQEALRTGVKVPFIFRVERRYDEKVAHFGI